MGRKVHFVTLEKVYGETFRLFFRNIITLLTPVIPAFLIFGFVFYRYIAFVVNLADSGGGDIYGVYRYLGWFTLISLSLIPLIYGEIKLASNLYLDVRGRGRRHRQRIAAPFFPLSLDGNPLRSGRYGGHDSPYLPLLRLHAGLVRCPRSYSWWKRRSPGRPLNAAGL